MTYFKEVKVDTNNTTGDAFGRVRVSTPRTLFDAKQLHDNAPLFWDEQEVSGAGTTTSYSSNRASTTMGVTLNTAGRRVRQTYQRFNYQPGKSLLVLMTSVFCKNGGGPGITKRMGYMDDNNGLFLEQDGGVYYLVKRSNVTGSPVETRIAQTNWNVDPLNGSGNSGITIDFTKSNIFVIDLEWLGVGRVRLGFNIDGVTYVAHEFLNANVLDSVYMSTPNLPLRYEIINDGTGIAEEIECICTSVISEGDLDPLGVNRYISTAGTHCDANTADTIYAIIGIRLKSSYIGTVIEFLEMSMINEQGDDYEWLLIFNPTVAGTFTYTSLANSAIEYALGNTPNTVTGGTQLAGGWVKSAGSVGAITSQLDNALSLGASISGTVDEIVLCARPLTNGADIQAGIIWKELL